MNRQQFFHWINDPGSLQAEDSGSLKELISDYPFFQSARTLYLLNLKLLHDYRFEPELKKAATFAPDRSRLRELILAGDIQPDNLDKQAYESNPLPVKAAEKQKDFHLEKLEQQIRASLKEIELKKSQLQELLEEKKAITGNQDENEGIENEGELLPFRSLPKDKLLEEFLVEQQASPGRKGIFYNPEDSARKSIEESDDILSETLARLVAAQGKKDKSIKIYQKLMLKYPQKSSYFAAQIEKLRKES